MIELTSTLIENELEEVGIASKVIFPNIMLSITISTLSYLINIIDSTFLAGCCLSIRTSIPVVPILTKTSHALSIHQVNICKTEEREVCLHTIIACIGCPGAIILQVRPFLRQVAGSLIGHASNILTLTIGKELGTLIALSLFTLCIDITFIELIHELRAQAELAPTTFCTEIGNILVGIRHTQLSAHQVSGRTPAYGMLCTYRQGEDNFVGTLVVISIEEFAVIIFQGVAHAHHLIASLLALSILRHTSINLAVQIKLGKQGIGSALRSLTVRTGGCRKHITYTILQFTLDIIECLLRSITWRDKTAHRIILCYHRNVAIEIESMEVEQGAHEANFSPILLHLYLVIAAEASAIGIAEELIAEGDVVVDAIIHI